MPSERAAAACTSPDASICCNAPQSPAIVRLKALVMLFMVVDLINYL